MAEQAGINVGIKIDGIEGLEKAYNKAVELSNKMSGLFETVTNPNFKLDLGNKALEQATKLNEKLGLTKDIVKQIHDGAQSVASPLTSLNEKTDLLNSKFKNTGDSIDGLSNRIKDTSNVTKTLTENSSHNNDQMKQAIVILGQISDDMRKNNELQKQQTTLSKETSSSLKDIVGINERIYTGQGRQTDAIKTTNVQIGQTRLKINEIISGQEKFIDTLKHSETEAGNLKGKLDGVKSSSDLKETIQTNTNNAEGFRNKIFGVRGEAEKTSNTFKDMLGANLVSNGITNVLTGLGNQLREVNSEAKEFVINQQKMTAAWTTLTGNASQGKAMTKEVNDWSTAMGQDVDIVNELAQGFYHLHSSNEETTLMTKGYLKMADAVGLTKDQLKALSQDTVHSLAQGKVTNGMLNQTAAYLPMINEGLAEHMSKVNADGHLTASSTEASSKAINKQKKAYTDMFNEMHTGSKNSAADLQGYLNKGLISQDKFNQLNKQISDGHKVSNADVKSAIGLQAKYAASAASASDNVGKSTEITVKDLHKLVKEGKVSAQDFEDVISDYTNDKDGKYKDAAENMMKTMWGAQRTLKAQAPKLLSDFYQPFLEAKSPFALALSKWSTDKSTEAAFGRIGKATEKGIETISEAFGKNFTTKSFTDRMNKGLDNLAKSITKISNGIADHKDEISSFFKTLKETGKITGAVGIKVMATEVTILSKALLPLLEFVGDHQNVMVPLIASMFAMSQATKIMNLALLPLTSTAKLVSGPLKGVRALLTGFSGKGVSKEAGLVTKSFNFMGKVVNKSFKFVADKMIWGTQIITKNLKLLVSGVKKAAFDFGKNLFKMSKAAFKASSKVAKSMWRMAKDSAKYMWKVTKDAGKMALRFAKSMGRMARDAAKTSAKVAMSMGKMALSVVKSMATMAISFATNPFGIAILAITAIGVGLYELYKHFKPFRDFVNGIGSFVKKAFGGIIDFFKNNWKTIGLFILNPFAGISKMLYDHVKPFHNFVDKVGGVIKKGFEGFVKFIKNPFKAIGGAFDDLKGKSVKAFDSMGKKAGDIGKNIGDSFKNAPKTVQGHMNNLKNGVSNVFSDLQKNSPKQLDGMWKTINGITKDKAKVNADLTKVGADLMHGHWSNLGKDMNKTTTDMWNGIKNAFKSTFDWLDKLTGGKLTDIWNWFKNISKSIDDTVGGMWKSVKDSFNNSLKWVSDIWNKTWGAISDFGKGIWNGISDFVGKFWGGMKSVFKSSGDDITNIWKNTWNAVSGFFNDIWKGIKKMAGDGINGIVGVLNGGIGGINSVISTFGGKKETIGKISPVKFATGTNNGALEHHTYAMLNDGHDSPETNNREMAILPTGQAFIPQERNWTGVLPKGTEILNATETKNVMNMNNIQHFANGQHSNNWIDNATSAISNVTGGVSNIFNNTVETVKDVGGSVWGTIKDFGKNLEQGFKMATEIASDPGKYIKDLIKAPNVKGDVMQNLGLGMFDKAKDSATDFWNTAWNEVGGLMSGGTASGTQGDFLKWAEKNLTGRPYVLGGFDCSEMVKEALAHVGVNAGRDTVAQEHSGKFNRISKEEAKPGDLVYFGTSGADAHTGIYTGPGKFFNQHPSNHGPGGADISTISAAEAADGPARYYHVKGLSAEDDKPKTTSDSGLVKYVHSMLDNNMFKWIKDNFSQFFESDDGDADGTSIAPAGDHKNWLKQAGIPESQFDMYNYIVNHESTWNPHAKNPGSDAYGLPQALPGSKMASAGKDWHDNPITQLKWMKGYVKERYGGIKGAYNKWRADGWYANGGIVNNEQIAHIAEGNNQEAIIPIGDKAKRPRAFELLKETFKLLKPTKKEKRDVIGGDDDPHKNDPSNPNPGNDGSDDNVGSSSLFGSSLGKNIFNNKRSGNVSITMNPTINISLSGNADESIKDQVEKAVRQAMEQSVDELVPKIGGLEF